MSCWKLSFLLLLLSERLNPRRDAPLAFAITMVMCSGLDFPKQEPELMKMPNPTSTRGAAKNDP